MNAWELGPNGQAEATRQARELDGDRLDYGPLFAALEFAAAASVDDLIQVEGVTIPRALFREVTTE